MQEQNFSNHVRRDKPYLALMVLNLTLVIAAVRFGGLHFHTLNWLLLGLAVAVTSATITARTYALRNQNRTIRLEEALRAQRLGVDQTSLTLPQIIALRFAGDEELPALSRRAATESLTPKAIKQAIVRWRADYQRA